MTARYGSFAARDETFSPLPLYAVAFVGAAFLHQYNALIKGTLIGLGIEVDFALFVIPVIAATGLVLLFRNPYLSLFAPTVLPLMLFAGWVVASLVWTDAYYTEPSEAVARVFGQGFSLAHYKALDFLTGCAIPFLVASLFAQVHFAALRVHVGAAFALMVVVVPYVFLNTVETDLRNEVGYVQVGIISNVDYIGFGLYFATWTVMALVVAFRNTRGPMVLAVACGGALMAMHAILSSGSTQALLAPIVVAGLMIFVELGRDWSKRNFVRWLSLLTLAIIGLLLIAAIWSRDTLYDYDDFTGINRLLFKIAYTTTGRGELFDLAWSGFLESPLVGLGLAGYSTISNTSLKAYPHNIVLEIMCELGLVGIGLFAWFAWRMWKAVRVVLGQQTLLGDLVVFTCAVHVLSALVSSGLNDHRTLFLYLGYAAGLANAMRASDTAVMPYRRDADA